MCVVDLEPSGFVPPWDSNNEFLRTFRQTRLQVIPREPKQTKKNNGVQKTQTLPWSSWSRGNRFECSSLPRTCFKSKSLPNSVIFITELHLRVFLTLCSSSNSGKSLWITKLTYLTVWINKLQRILLRT